MYATVVGQIENLTGQCIRVLVADPVMERIKGFRIEGKDYTVTLADSYHYFLKALEDEHFDLAIVAAMYTAPNCQMNDMVTPLKVAKMRGKVKGVIIITPSTQDGIKQVRELRAGGVPAVYFPHDYSHPSVHLETKVF